MRRSTVAVIVVTLIGFACRLPLTFASGIWADEGMALNVVAIPSLRGMLEFLRFNESHPPLFYLILRGWRSVAGTSDFAALCLMLTLATLLIPITYIVSRSFMSARASIVAASLVALSPSLAEHSAQIRPYGLLYLLGLLSCHFLATAIGSHRWSHWLGYSIITALMLYTHNWAWLVFAGQVVAGLFVVLRLYGRERQSTAIAFGVAVCAVLLAYAPWFPTLVFQAAHAGHSGLQLNSVSDRLWFFIASVLSVPDYLLLGLYPRNAFPLVLLAALVAGSTILATGVPTVVERVLPTLGYGDAPETGKSPAAQIFIITVCIALFSAILFSPVTFLFIQRCVAMLTPMFLVWAIAAIVPAMKHGSRINSFRLVSGVGVFLLSLEAAGIAALVPTERSNAREVAAMIRANMHGDDLLIIAPEWFPPSFNHYFAPSIEQHDYPQQGRSGLVSFTTPQRRSVDPVARLQLAQVIAGARSSGRRVWFVSERTYLRYADDALPTLKGDADTGRYAPVRRAKEARDMLIDAYGPADTSHFVDGKVSRYEELLPFLFTPSRDSRNKF